MLQALKAVFGDLLNGFRGRVPQRCLKWLSNLLMALNTLGDAAQPWRLEFLLMLLTGQQTQLFKQGIRYIDAADKGLLTIFMSANAGQTHA